MTGIDPESSGIQKLDTSEKVSAALMWIILTAPRAQSGLLSCDQLRQPAAYVWRFFRAGKVSPNRATTRNFARGRSIANRHQEHIGLTAQEATQLKQLAAIHVAAIDGVEAARPLV